MKTSQESFYHYVRTTRRTDLDSSWVLLHIGYISSNMAHAIRGDTAASQLDNIS